MTAFWTDRRGEFFFANFDVLYATRVINNCFEQVLWRRIADSQTAHRVHVARLVTLQRLGPFDTDRVDRARIWRHQGRLFAVLSSQRR